MPATAFEFPPQPNADAINNVGGAVQTRQGADGSGQILLWNPSANRFMQVSFDWTPYSVISFGAKGDGVADDTSKFVAACQVGAYVVVPAGLYKISTLILPARVKLELLPGAVLLVSDHIELADDGIKLIGYSYQSTATGGLGVYDKLANIVYTGPANGVPLRCNTSHNANGWYIDGILVDCQEIAGTVGCQIGKGPNQAQGISGAFNTIGSLTIVNAMSKGLDIQGIQNSDFGRINVELTSDAYFSSGIAVHFNSLNVVTLVGIAYVSVGGYQTGVMFGDPTFSNNLVISNCTVGNYDTQSVIQGIPGNSGCAVNFLSASHCGITNALLAGPGGNDPPVQDGSTRGVKFGGSTTQAQYCFVQGCLVPNFMVSCEGFAWQDIRITGNHFAVSSSNSSRRIFKNTGGGPQRIQGNYGKGQPNKLSGQISPSFIEIDDYTGFDDVVVSNINVNNAPDGTFTVAEGWSVTVQDGSTTQIYRRGSTGPDGICGRVEVIETSSGAYGKFVLRGSGSTATVLAENPDSSYANTDTAGKICVFYDSGSGNYLLKNNLGLARRFCICPGGFRNW